MKIKGEYEYTPNMWIIGIGADIEDKKKITFYLGLVVFQFTLTFNWRRSERNT